MRTLVLLLVCGLLGVFSAQVALAVQTPDVTASDLQDDPEQLVRQLGDRSFSVRRRATAQLIEIGSHALEALERGVQSKDREIRFRSQHALEIVRQNDFQRRLQAFAAGQPLSDSYQLPAWGRFAKEVGVTSEARTLFVEMQQAEPELLATLEDSPSHVNEVLTERIAQLQDSIAHGEQAQQLPLGSLVTILFLLNTENIQLPITVTQSIGSYFRYPNFAGAIRAGSQRTILRKMLGQWIEESHGWDAYHAMFLAMQYDLPTGLAPARRILEGDLDAQNQTYFICYALHTIARFGDQSYQGLVEPFLENNTPYGGTGAIGNHTKFRTQVRDIALATLVHLAGLNHKDFGFTRYRPHSSQVFNTSSVAFEDDDKREESIAKWRQFVQGQQEEER